MNLVFGTYPPLLGGESPNEPAQLMRALSKKVCLVFGLLMDLLDCIWK